jgi:anti-anti-sigma factor
MSVTFHIREPEAAIQIRGHFNFAEHAAFRDASKAILAHSKLHVIEIDLMDVDYLDSSALGMLLVLREQACDKGVKRILISHASPTIRQIFVIAKFDKFFEIA